MPADIKRRKTDEEFLPTEVKTQLKYEYVPGFGGEKVSECLPGALPVKGNTPQRCPYGLYAELLSGTAFTKPRDSNQRVWYYRIRPAAVHEEMKPVSGFNLTKKCTVADPRQRRWSPHPIPEKEHCFISGLVPMAGAGDECSKSGTKIYMYTATKSMDNSAFMNSDGDFLIVAQQGTLDVVTELGRMEVRPGEICVIQRGIRFKVDIASESVRGYVCELFDGHFKLPDLGPIGTSGLANPRDFLTPVAWYENRETDFTIYTKFGGDLFSQKQNHSPFDVVAWHGNYTPYKYDLALFCAVNSVTYDHIDPSIFTVLTCQTADPGTAAMDFVIFPPRYMVQMDTFRPPYYHKNCMSELMGNICGAYEAKAKGFLPGGMTLHSCMVGHGPDANGFEKASGLDTSVPQVCSFGIFLHL